MLILAMPATPIPNAAAPSNTRMAREPGGIENESVKTRKAREKKKLSPEVARIPASTTGTSQTARPNLGDA